MQVVRHLLAVGADAECAAVVERLDGLGQQARGLQEVVDADGHEHVQLEVALAGRHADGHVVAHDLHGHHRDRFALRRVDLAGHDGGAGLVLGDEDLAETVARAGGQPADVVCDLHHVRRQRLERAVREYDLVLARQRVELVFRRAELPSRQRGDLFGHLDVEALRRVQSGADGGAAEGQLAQLRQRKFDHLFVFF